MQRKIYQYTASGELIKVFQSQEAASLATGVKQPNISACCNGSIKTAGGFIWKAEGEPVKKVYRIGYDGHIMDSFPSPLAAATECGVSHDGIIAVCNGKQKKAGEWGWTYDIPKEPFVQPRLNLYPNDIKNTTSIGSMTADTILDRIQSPDPRTAEMYSQIYEAELLQDWAWKAELKSKLYYIVPCTVCKGSRSYANIQSFTGLVAFDFDHVDNAPGLRDYLFETHPHLIASWLSASKKGVKALARIPVVTSVEEFKDYYWGIAKVFNRYVGFDTATQNAVLPLFLSYDPGMKRRSFEDTLVWTKKGTNPKMPKEYEPKALPKIDYSKFEVYDILDHLSRAINQIDGNGHPQVRAASYAAGGFVGAGYIDLATADELMAKLIDENAYLSKGTAGYVKTAKEMIRRGVEKPLVL